MLFRSLFAARRRHCDGLRFFVERVVALLPHGKTEIRLYRAAGGQLLFRRKSEDHHNDGDARQKEIRKDFPRGRRRLCRLDLARRAGTCFKIFGKNVSRTFL